MGKDGSLSDGVLRKIILSYAYVAVWIFLSFTVIVYNKYILDRKMYNWPFPISLTIIHMSFCSSLAFFLVRILKIVEPISMSRGYAPPGWRAVGSQSRVRALRRKRSPSSTAPKEVT